MLIIFVNLNLLGACPLSPEQLPDAQVRNIYSFSCRLTITLIFSIE